uniref:Superfamily I DNA/RNA helicase n=1 Tax=uncultured marine thaumarchaeote AD1000_02_C08 TaxID=1455880 RepID=A0A075FL99_9ARCH|nr:Superfamily I DNA/RNA helicase [uncultured marine thaumarchaeote AD1000_02_C08]
MNVFTFHSYALDTIDENEVLSTNLLRYAIFRFLKHNKILNYSDERLLNHFVPQIENLMRYVKSFGITPDEIDLIEVKNILKETTNTQKRKWTSSLIIF